MHLHLLVFCPMATLFSCLPGFTTFLVSPTEYSPNRKGDLDRQTWRMSKRRTTRRSCTSMKSCFVHRNLGKKNYFVTEAVSKRSIREPIEA